MNTGAKWGIGLTLVAGGGLLIYKGMDLKQKSDAADKLTMNLDDVSLEEATVKGVKIKAKFSIKNPSDKELGYENLYVKFSVPDSKGVLKKVADTVPDPMGTMIPANKTTQASAVAEIKFWDLLMMSADIALYLTSRTQGAKATRKAKVEWSYNSEGFPFSDTKEILI